MCDTLHIPWIQLLHGVSFDEDISHCWKSPACSRRHIDSVLDFYSHKV